ncbi:TfoX/Sxy family protein [Limimaricola sp.]|uniref:TfoX/Sxy family protein n=1 Tax=Limimaricola sp. TaxID=2211665 RepID=UPI00405821B5
MAYDEGLAELIRGDLGERSGISERRMFGGLAFMLYGNMVCGVTSQGAMYCVGKAREAEAMRIPGTGPMEFTGKPMGGMVAADDEAMADDGRRAALTRLAFEHAESLPAK